MLSAGNVQFIEWWSQAGFPDLFQWGLIQLRATSATPHESCLRVMCESISTAAANAPSQQLCKFWALGPEGRLCQPLDCWLHIQLG